MNEYVLFVKIGPRSSMQHRRSTRPRTYVRTTARTHDKIIYAGWVYVPSILSLVGVNSDIVISININSTSTKKHERLVIFYKESEKVRQL